MIEVWQYASGIFPDNFENYNLRDMFFELKKDIEQLNDKLSKG